MKIKVERSKNGFVKIQFNADQKYVSGNNPFLMEDEIDRLISNHYGCATDGNYTVRRMSDRLIVWYDKDCTIDMYLDVTKFFKACLALPLEKEITMDSASFNKVKVRGEEIKSWVVIGRLVHKSCRSTILNAKKIGLEKELKPILSRYVGKAEIYPDNDRLNLSFYFNGRYPGGCGYNGGIICHNAGTDTFAIELTSKPQPHYSVHT